MASLDDARKVQARGLDVGFLCLGWGGASAIESYTAALAAALATRGHRVHVLCLAPEADPWSMADDEVNGVSVRRIGRPLAHGNVADIASLGELARHPKAEDVLHAWMAEVPCDIVHVHHAGGFGLGTIPAIGDVGAPVALSLHDEWPLCPRGDMVRPSGERCEVAEAATCAECLKVTWPSLLPSGGGAEVGPDGGPVGSDEEAAGARTEFALEAIDVPTRVFVHRSELAATYSRAGVDASKLTLVEGTAEDVMLDVERGYVQTIVDVTGLEPALVHPIDGMGSGAAAPAEKSPEASRKGGLLGRLFGRS